jgi:hypothetical protein
MLAQAVAYLPKMRELSSSCLYLLSWLLSVKVDSICLRMSLVDCTFFWLLLAKLTDVTVPPVIVATKSGLPLALLPDAQCLKSLCAAG